MNFTIITSVLNAVAQLEITAKSIRAQRKHLQWIVVDGGSSDNIHEFVKNNLDVVTDFIPGPDKGIYDAWNKALPLVKGQWVIFLGAGDTFVNGDVLWDVSNLLNGLSKKFEIAYGNTLLCAEATGEVLSRDSKSWADIQGTKHFLLPVLPSHAGVFHRRTLFERVGRFDDSYKIAADTKMQLQALQHGTFFCLTIDIANVMAGGISFKAENHCRILAEHRRIATELGITISYASLVMDYMNVWAKRMLFFLFGKRISYQLFDIARYFQGINPKWSRG